MLRIKKPYTTLVVKHYEIQYKIIHKEILCSNVSC